MSDRFRLSTTRLESMTLHTYFYRIILKAGAAAMIVLASISVDIHEATARDDEPKNAYAYVLRGQYRLGRKEYALAIADFNTALEIDPKSAPAYHGRASASVELSEYDIAIADFTKALEINPQDDASYTGRGMALYKKHNYENAIADFTSAIELSPNFDVPYFDRGIVFDEIKEYDKAIADFTAAIENNPKSPDNLSRRGLSWFHKKIYDKAIADFNAAIELDPKFIFAYNQRGSSWFAKKEYDKAIADFTNAIRLDPRSAFGYGMRGAVWNEKNEYDKALADFDKAIGINPVYSSPYVSRAVIEFLSEKRNVHKTVSLLIKNCDPKDEYATYGVLIGVFAARKSGRKDLVERYLDDVVKRTVARNWPYPVVQYLRGNMSEKELISAAADVGQMTEARCYIGLNLECDGREAEAVEHFRWVERSGDSTYSEYEIALHELKKLEARRK